MNDKMKLVTLDNGVTLVSRKFAGEATTHLQWSVGRGAYDEQPHEYGVAHFLEHTLVHPEIIYQPIMKRGAEVNAYTSYENIAMYARVLPENAAHAQHLLIDRGLISPPIEQRDFDREFGPIKMEITERLSNPNARLYVNANAAMCAGQPRAHYIAGTHADMDTHTLNKLHDFFQRARDPQGIIAVVAGNFDQRAFFRAAERSLRDLPQVGAGTRADPGRFAPGEAIFIEPPTRPGLAPHELPVGLLARFKAVSAASPDKLAYVVLGSMLSANMDSPLMAELREKRGLVYGVGAGLDAWRTDGTLQVSLNTSRGNIEQATQVLADTLARADSFLTPQRFEDTRALIKFKFADGVEDSENWASRVVTDMGTYGRIRSRSEMLAAFESITLADVKRAAASAFSQQPFVAVQGAVEGLSFKPVLDRALRL